MYFVYIIRNERGRIYTGQTCDIEKRLARHNSLLPSKKTSFTKKRGPWVLAYKEEYNTRQEAKIREKYLKTAIGRRFIRNIMGLAVDPPKAGS